MQKILVVYKDGQIKNSIAAELEREGYEVCSIDVESLDFTALDSSDLNLIVITLCSDVSSTWGIFLDFKEHFRDLPVVAYMGQRSGNHLKSAIKKVLT